jgi:hypothetical protein
MQILINVPDTLPKPIIKKRIKKLEESLKEEAEKSKKKTSKWALLAERVANNHIHLAGYSEQLKKDMQEFRAGTHAAGAMHRLSRQGRCLPQPDGEENSQAGVEPLRVGA